MGNVLRIGSDDHGLGCITPNNALILHNLRDTVVSGNTMYMSSLKETLIDKGDHGPNVIIQDNVGTPLPTPMSLENSGTTISEAASRDFWNVRMSKGI